MVLSEGDVMVTSATQQRKEKTMVKAKSWRKRSFFDILNYTTCRMPCLWVIDGGQKQCRFLADPGKIFYPAYKKQHHEAVIAALADVEHWVEGIDRLGLHPLIYRP